MKCNCGGTLVPIKNSWLSKDSNENDLIIHGIDFFRCDNCYSDFPCDDSYDYAEQNPSQMRIERLKSTLY